VHRFDASRLAHSLHRDRAPPARTPSRDLLHTLGIVRILLVSDLHYTLPQLDWVVRSAPSVRPRRPGRRSARHQLDRVARRQSVVILRYLALLQAAGRVVIGSGNHDLTGPDAQGEQAALWLAEARAAGVPTDGDSLTCGDTLVTICPWWDGPLGRADVAAQLAADAGRRPKRWIWVYHWPPLGSPTCWTGKRHYGDADLNGWIVEHEPDWSSPATSTSRRSSPPARGPIASARPGCSTPAARSARCRAMSTSISPAAPRRGDR
jgi:hypothetical protein